jgi:hypothetical protein
MTGAPAAARSRRPVARRPPEAVAERAWRELGVARPVERDLDADEAMRAARDLGAEAAPGLP